MNTALRQIARGVARTLLPRGVAYPVLTGPLKGMRFVHGSLAGPGGGASVYIDAVEPEQGHRMVRSLRPGDTFFDVGANVGYYSLLASRIVGERGRVIAFEPLLDNVAYLSKHVRLNHLANVDVLAVACSDANGIVTFARGANGALGKIAENGSGGDMLVPALSLDDFHARTGLLPNVMKIDVEGAELRVLTGAQALLDKSRPTIFLSTHGDEMREQCLAFLRERRYEVTPINTPELNLATEYMAVAAGQ